MPFRRNASRIADAVRLIQSGRIRAELTQIKELTGEGHRNGA